MPSMLLENSDYLVYEYIEGQKEPRLTLYYLPADRANLWDLINAAHKQGRRIVVRELGNILIDWSGDAG